MYVLHLQFTAWWPCLLWVVRCCGGKSCRRLWCISSVVCSSAPTHRQCVSSSANPSSLLWTPPQVRLDAVPAVQLLLLVSEEIRVINCKYSFLSILIGFKDISFPSPGKKLWSLSLKNIESQVVLLPDLQGDSDPDLLVATLPADEVCQPSPLHLHIHIVQAR